MQTQKNTAPVANASEAAKPEAPAFVLAQVTAEVSAAATKAIGGAFVDYRKANVKAENRLIADTVAAALLIGVPITRAQWLKQFQPDAKAEAMRKAKAYGYEKATVDNHFSRAIWLILATLLKPADYDPAAKGADGKAQGPHWSQPLAGESFRDVCDRVSKGVIDAKLPDGTWVIERAEDGSAKLPGPSKGSTGPAIVTAAPGTAATAAKADGEPAGDSAKAKAEARRTAATVLMGNVKDAERLLILLDKHASDLRKLLDDKVKA